MTAADLTLVGLSEDGGHLLLADAAGESYRVPLDRALRAAARQDHSRPVAPGRPDMSPREVQALIRGGASTEEVVELSGWSQEKIEKYEGPIVAEREFVASLATQVRLRSAEGDALLAARVAERLARRGVDPAAASWDAWRAAGRPWTLQLAFPAGGRLREARWSFDVQTRAVSPEDDEARWLSGEVEHDTRPAPLVPLGGTRTVYDVDADGGIDQGSPEAVHAPAEPGPDLAPERPRSAARRHEPDEDADLEATMRERSRARRRRKPSPRPAATDQDALPVAVAPAAQPAGAVSPEPEVEHPAVETERPAPELADLREPAPESLPEPPMTPPAAESPVALPTGSLPTGTSVPAPPASELDAVVDAVIADAEAQGRIPAAPDAEPVADDEPTDAEAEVPVPAVQAGPTDDEASEPHVPGEELEVETAEDETAPPLEALATEPDATEPRLPDDEPVAVEAEAPAPTAEPAATDDEASEPRVPGEELEVETAEDETAPPLEALATEPDAAEARLPDDEPVAVEAEAPAPTTPAATDDEASEPRVPGEELEVETAEDETAPPLEALATEPDGADPGRTEQPEEHPATGDEPPSAPSPIPDAEPEPEAAAPEPAPTGRAARRAAQNKRKGRASVPSWDDIMFGPKSD